MHETGQTSTQDLSFTSMHGWVITYATSVPHFLVAYEVSATRSGAVTPTSPRHQLRLPTFAAVSTLLHQPLTSWVLARAEEAGAALGRRDQAPWLRWLARTQQHSICFTIAAGQHSWRKIEDSHVVGPLK